MNNKAVMFPSTWFSHKLQSDLFKAGLCMPVYANAFEDVFGLASGSVPKDVFGVCMVPGFATEDCKVMDDLKHIQGCPLYDRYWNSPDKMLYALVSPPLSMFDHLHRVGHKVTLVNQAPSTVTLYESVPYHFIQEVHHLLNSCIGRFAHDMNAKVSLVGAKLNPLSSGRYNIVLFVITPKPPNPQTSSFQKMHQYYIADNESALMSKFRVIPLPDTRVDHHDTVLKLCFSPACDVVTQDDDLHARVFANVQPVIQVFNSSFDSFIQFRYVRINTHSGSHQPVIIIGIVDKNPNYNETQDVTCYQNLVHVLTDLLSSITNWDTSCITCTQQYHNCTFV
jgi:hypothetical protein